MNLLAETNIVDNLWAFIGWAGAISGWTVVAVMWFLNRGLRTQIKAGIDDIRSQIK